MFTTGTAQDKTVLHTGEQTFAKNLLPTLQMNRKMHLSTSVMQQEHSHVEYCLEVDSWMYSHIARCEVLVDAAMNFSALSKVTTSNLVDVYRLWQSNKLLPLTPNDKIRIPPKRRYFYQSVRGHSAVRMNEQWSTQEFCSGGGGGQQIQLRTEDRENGDLGAVAP